VFLLVLLAACAPNAAPTPTPIPTPTPRQIAQQSATQMALIKSFHFSIDLTGRRKTIDPLATLVLRHADGDVARPDKAQSKIKVSAGGLIVEVQAVGIGDKQWLTNPLTQRWEEAPANWGYNPAVLFDTRTGLASLLQRVESLMRTADDSLDGKTHVRLTGKIAGTEVATMTAGMITGSDVSFTLWIGADDFILRKVHLTERDANEPEATEWDIVLSAFDKPVSIEPPVVR